LVAKKAPAYTPIGDELSLPSTFVQAALALDKAAEFAVESRNADQLTQIAMVWIEMGARLNAPNGDDDEEDDEGDVAGESEDYPLGFASPAVDAKIREKRKNNADES
jgi:hypothetical protein